MIDDSLRGPAQRGSGTRLTALIVACSLFMQGLDGTIIATALPAMSETLGASPADMSLALIAYLLSLTICIPASGWIADRFGACTVFRAAIILFTLASVLCGRADSLAFLAAARALQGAGGAMMLPIGRLVLLRRAPRHEYVTAMAWLSTPAMLGPVIGPLLGGIITTYLDWRWIFYINLPIGLLGIALVTLFLHDDEPPIRTRLDFVGLLLCAGTVGCLTVALELNATRSGGHGFAAIMLASSALFAVAYFAHARTHRAPLLDLSLFEDTTFRVSMLAGIPFRLGAGAVPFLLPMMLQLGLGMSPLNSGIITGFSSAGALLMMPVLLVALRRFGFRLTLLVNGALCAVSLAATAAFRPSWPVALICTVLVAAGFFRSVQFTAFNTIAYADIPEGRNSAATSLQSTLQQLSLTLGVSAGAAALGASMAIGGHALPTLADFSAAFLFVGAVSLAACPLLLPLHRTAGAEFSGQTVVPAREV
jgi:EmrB/QacA subfamily drug resistance transporter